MKVLSNPAILDESNPGKIEEMDWDKMSHQIEKLLNEVNQVGLQHKEPHQFHEGRKSMRKLLNSLNASHDAFGFKDKDIEAMTGLVEVYGKAQDNFIAYEWLQQNNFEKQAETMLGIYAQNQQKALDEAARFAKSGALERVKDSIQ